jgi:hypothetical protein
MIYEKEYQVVDDTHYDKRTPPEVVKILEHSRKTRTRIVITYGNVETCEAWEDATPNRGHVGRSTGKAIPLLIRTPRSNGGEGILDHCIIQIRESLGGKILYKKVKA